MSLTILFEDEYVICVTKPNNVVVHHAHHSRNVSDEQSLLQLLDKQLGGKFYPIHRLDRKTSGIILLAKETKHVSKFQELFTNNEIQKTYYGIVRGHSVDSKIIKGELVAKGPMITLGYINKELNDRKFIFNKEKSTFFTGDLVEQKFGKVICKGRKDHLVKIRGYRIEIPFVEAKLRAIKMVEQCVVV